MGEMVEGVISPIWLGLNAAGYLLGLGDSQTNWLRLLGYLSVSCALSVAVLLAWRLGKQLAASVRRPNDVTTNGDRSAPLLLAMATVVLLGTEQRFLVSASTGLETALTAAIVLAVLYSRSHSHLPLQRTLLLVAVLVRPECMLFVLTLPLHQAARRRSYWIPLVVGLTVIVVTRWTLFGTAVPHPYWLYLRSSADHILFGLTYLRNVGLHYPLCLALPLLLLPRLPRNLALDLLLISLLWLAGILRSGGDNYPYARLVMPLIPAMTGLRSCRNQLFPTVAVGTGSLASRTHRTGRRFSECLHGDNHAPHLLHHAAARRDGAEYATQARRALHCAQLSERIHCRRQRRRDWLFLGAGNG